MNKKFIRVMGLCLGLSLVGPLSLNAQKVTFNGERLSLKQSLSGLSLSRSTRLLTIRTNWMSTGRLS